MNFLVIVAYNDFFFDKKTYFKFNKNCNILIKVKVIVTKLKLKENKYLHVNSVLI